MKKTDNNRKSFVKRNTNETKIEVKVNLDGKGINCINTGLPFFDHMIQQLSKHSLIDMELNCLGDLHIDSHHTVEDVGWALGKAFSDALGHKKGIKRYSFNYLPMDECLTRCCIDISGRPWLIWNVFLPSLATINPCVKTLLNGDSPVTAIPGSIESWNQPRCWSLPSR